MSKMMIRQACAALLSGLALVVAADVASAADQKAVTKVAVESPLVKVDQAWVRPMVKGQTATGGFMNLTATQNLTLVGFAMSTPGVPELHEMVMDGSVMRMHAVDTLALPAGQTVSLRPGAQHLMLTELKQPLQEGSEVSLTLKLKTAEGKLVTQDIKVPVKVMPMAMPAMKGDAMGGHHHDMHH